MFEWIRKIWDALVWVAQEIVKGIWAGLAQLFEWLWYLWQFLTLQIQTGAKVLINNLMMAFPTTQDWDTSAVTAYASVANAWVALDHGLTLLGLYLVFWFSFVSVKFLLKFIPLIG